VLAGLDDRSSSRQVIEHNLYGTDNRQTAAEFNWSPKRKLPSILEEIATHAEQNPNWLDLSAP
jgi:hypothetical protein